MRDEDFDDADDAACPPDELTAANDPVDAGFPCDFTAVDCRVLGSLVEKEKATPQNYPLTLNALRLACNQSSNRDPVVDLDDHTIEASLTSLRERHLTRIVYSTSNRSAKYRHVLDERLRLDDAELAVLCVLFLRGPQTLGEIKGRTERLHPFADLGAVQATLDGLAHHREGTFIVRLERRPGQKDARYAHLLSGPVADPHPLAPAEFVEPTPTGASSDRATVGELRAEVDELRDRLAELRADFDEFRAAFE